MKEEIYSWIKNLAVFYILLTTVVHLVPDKKYGLGNNHCAAAATSFMSGRQASKNIL